MPRTIKKPLTQHEENYPTLSAHRTSRRGFLATGLAAAGAGALVTGCPGLFPPVDGDMPAPDWARIRFPADPDDRGVYLIDNGYARFYAVALTWTEDVAMFAQDDRVALTDRLASEVGDCTYDELQGGDLSNLQERMRQVLNEAYNENTGDVGEDWFNYVELYMVRLDAPVGLDGIAGGDPEYP